VLISKFKVQVRIVLQVNTWWIAVQAQYSKELSMDFKREAVLVKWKAFCNMWKA
jgi:hypothetical protein